MNGFTVELRFSGTPAQLSAETDAASVLEVTGGTVTGARQTDEGVNPVWEVTVTPNGPGEDVTIRVPVRHHPSRLPRDRQRAARSGLACPVAARLACNSKGLDRPSEGGRRLRVETYATNSRGENR